jgi:hypothetical protein
MVALIVLLIIAVAISVIGLVLSTRPTRAEVKRTVRRRETPRVRTVGQPRPRQVATSQIRRRPAGAASLAVAPGRVYEETLPVREIPWKVLLLALVSLLILGYYGLQLFAPHTGFLLLGTSAPDATATAQSATSPHYDATSKLVRISQLDPAQYYSQRQYQTWAYSACSAAAMTVVINAYGHHYRIADILQVESAIGEITPQEGLLEEVGIARTAARFSFDTTWGHNLSLDQVIAIANGGRPVIVSFPPDRFPGGHLLVVRGGSSSTVYLTDSSRLDYTSMTRSRFLSLWGGFYAVLTPQRS